MRSFKSSIFALAALASFANAAQAQTVNQAPTISGSPRTSMPTNTTFDFTPTARDPEGSRLTYSIVNRPSWAAFSTGNGRIFGYPKSAGTWNNIQIRVSDGVNSAVMSFNLVVGTPTANSAPTISGTPATSVSANGTYNFRPTANDADGNTLAYSISNRPSWATFSTATGQLSGTPSASQVGSYANITISVSDGRATTALRSFSINVVDVSTGSASLSWTPPTENTDGTALTNLAGYRVVYGTSPSALNQTVQVANVGLTNYTIDNLSPGTYYFSVRAYASNGTESVNSTVMSKVIN